MGVFLSESAVLGSHEPDLAAPVEAQGLRGHDDAPDSQIEPGQVGGTD